MNRWNIRYIHLFSRDGRRLDLELKTGEVNVVCGASNTGKSALIEIIDYTIGSSRCKIPDYIRRATSWVATTWVKNDQEVLLARKIPPRTRKTSEDCLFRTGDLSELTTDGKELTPNANCEGLLNQFAQVLGLGTMVTEQSWGKEAKAIGPRSFAPFLFQSSGVITNPSILLRGLEGSKRQYIIDCFPYHVGAVDEKSVELLEKLRRRRRQKKSLMREVLNNELLVSNRTSRAETLVTESVELGLIDPSYMEVDTDTKIIALSKLQEWTSSPEKVEEDSQLAAFYLKEEETVKKIAQLRSRLRAANEMINASDNFGGSVRKQKKRLESIELFRDFESIHECPFCGSSDEQDVDCEMNQLREALDKLQNELKTVGKGRPRLDSYIRELQSEIEQETQILKGIRANIEAIVRERENLMKELALDARRNRVIGRVSLFLESSKGSSRGINLQGELDSIRREISDLENLVGRDVLDDALQEARARINHFATELLAELPMAGHYRDNTASINYRNLEVSLIAPSRAIPMEDLGSDENWLSLHLAFALSFHRLFEERERPIPGVLVLDQVSRPYYAEESAKEESDLTSADKKAVRQYIHFLFSEVSRREGLQILLLEHARLLDDDVYRNSIVREWEVDDGLIPSDWPLDESKK
ncbi:DUF3732 domain-containing protein [Acanthopleuribacter pedis]|uniref:DUF3732 domain-containing protein n=1 Tax=Acanthopleuribacter pedis TaxID=442870 RepID=A0A8J7QJJ0_9BACT|nr:DUF3732 domain-containing protein [Acanthopleuribacter pedis]MBO1319373.1 DUF3732 domain-containing protein [Acanthopleuribacter pedis]